MKTGTKIAIGALVLSAAGVGVAFALRGQGGNLHIFKSREAYMESDELPTGTSMVIVGYSPDHPQAPTVEALLVEMAGRFGDVHFVGLPRDVAVDSVGMEFIGSGWGGVAAGSDTQAYEVAWEGPEDKTQLRNDLLAAVATVSDTEVEEASISLG